ncbi:hypothetical protein BGZ76_004242 [Entomortierella beljakovae]|nr:hypothetical protein BGZ76_004242 [Entomortierella beljakovae]
MTSDIPLFCVIEFNSTPFSVYINPSNTIGDLKKAIKKEKANEFAKLDAYKLTLFQIDAPSTPKRPINLDMLTNERINPKVLDPTSDISEVYETDPSKETIHILVQKPVAATGKKLAMMCHCGASNLNYCGHEQLMNASC